MESLKENIDELKRWLLVGWSILLVTLYFILSLLHSDMVDGEKANRQALFDEISNQTLSLRCPTLSEPTIFDCIGDPTILKIAYFDEAWKSNDDLLKAAKLNYEKLQKFNLNNEPAIHCSVEDSLSTKRCVIDLCLKTILEQGRKIHMKNKRYGLQYTENTDLSSSLIQIPVPKYFFLIILQFLYLTTIFIGQYYYKKVSRIYLLLPRQSKADAKRLIRNDVKLISIRLLINPGQLLQPICSAALFLSALYFSYDSLHSETLQRLDLNGTNILLLIEILFSNLILCKSFQIWTSSRKSKLYFF